MPAGNEKFLSDIRAAVGALTESDPYFSDIPVITERLKNIQGKIDTLVGTAGGIALVLVTPVIGGALANVPGANFSDIKLIGRVLENTTVNKTGKEALDIAIYTSALWSQMKPDTLSSALRPDEPTILLGNDPKYLSYDISFLIEGGMSIDIPQLDQVAIDISDPEAVAIDPSLTPGAAVFYTLNNTQPAPRNPASQLYTAPFDANTPGTKIRARAWLAGYNPSPESKATIS